MQRTSGTLAYKNLLLLKHLRNARCKLTFSFSFFFDRKGARTIVRINRLNSLGHHETFSSIRLGAIHSQIRAYSKVFCTCFYIKFWNDTHRHTHAHIHTHIHTEAATDLASKFGSSNTEMPISP